MESNKLVPGLDIYNNQTGEVYGVVAFPKNLDEKYTLRRLKMQVWPKAYTWVMKKACNSSKDIELFELILELTNRDNMIIASISKLQGMSGMSRSKVHGFIKKLLNIGFLAKEDISVYMINPFVYIGDKAYITSRTAKAMLQVEWTKKHGYPPEPDELQEANNLISGSNIYPE